MNGLPILTMRDVWKNAVEKWPKKTAAVWDDPRALGSRWERLLPLFGEPELWPAWPALS